MDTIEDVKFDLMIIDGDFITRPFLIIPYKFNVPYMALMAR